MADTALRHYRNGDGLFDLENQLRVAHARHAAVRANIRRHALKRHHSGCARLFRDTRLLGIDDITDHAAFEHFWKRSFDVFSSCLFLHDSSPPDIYSTLVFSIILPLSPSTTTANRKWPTMPIS